MNRITTAALLLSSLLTAGVQAEQDVRLSVLDAYHSALERNYGLQSQQSIYRAEQQGVREARGALLPQIDATASYGASEYTRDFDLQSSITDNDVHTRYDVGVTQVVYSRRTFGNLDRARAFEALAGEELQAFRQNIGYLAVEGYLKASQLHEESAIVESELENHEKRLQQLEGMRSRGLASRADSLEAQARIDEVRAELHSLQSGYRAAMKNLEAVTGLDLHQRQLISIPARAWQGTPALIEQDWLTPALAGSGAVQRARGELNVAEATHSMEQGGFLPEAYLSLRHINNDTFATNLREETRLELQLRMPLFKGGSTTARTRQTKERIHASRYQLQDTENAIRVEVARLTEDLSGSHSRIQSLQAAQQSAEAALEAADRGFIGGVRSLNELLDSRNRVSRVQRSLTAERHNNLILQFKLRQTAGTLVASDITGIFGN